MRLELQSLLADVGEEAEVMRRVRHFRHRHMCRIVWRDFTRRADTLATVTEMTALADTCIDEVLNWLYPVCCRQWGTPMMVGPQERWYHRKWWCSAWGSWGT